MPLPILVGAGTFASTAPAPHASTRGGDLLLLFTQSSNQDVADPAGGWAEVPDSPQGTGTAASAGAVRLQCFWKRAVDGEGAATVVNPGNHVFSQMFTFRGVIETGNPYDVTSGGTAAASTSVSITGDTTTLANCLVVVGLGNAFDGTGEQVSSWANSDLAGFAQAGSGQSATGTGGGINVATGGKATAGAYGASTATLANSSAQAFMTIALKPAIGAWWAGSGAGNATATTMNVAWPTHLTDDIGILVLETDNEAVATPSGWAVVLNSPQGTGTAGVGDATRLSVFWKRAASAAEADAAIADPGNHVVGAIYTFRNVITSGDPWDVTTGNVITPSTTSLSATGVTTTVDNTVVMVIFTFATDIAAGTPQLSAWSNGTLVTFGEKFEFSTTQGNGGGFGLAAGTLGTAGASGTTTATLATGSLSGWMTIALKPPATGSPVTVTPDVIALTITTFAPSIGISNHQVTTPGVVALTLTTFAPVIHLTVVPPVASLTLATFAPTVAVSDNQRVVPDLATLTIATFAPTVAITNHQRVTPDLAMLTLATFAPTVAVTANVTATPDTASLSLTAFAPVVSFTAHQTVVPDTASLTLTTFAPGVTGGAGLTVTPDTGSLTLTTFAPTVSLSAHVTVTPGTATLTMTAFAPSAVLSDHQLVTPDTAALTLTGLAPTVTPSNHQTVTPGTLTLVLSSFAPTVGTLVPVPRNATATITVPAGPSAAITVPESSATITTPNRPRATVEV